MNENNIIIYNTARSKASVSQLVKDGTAWMSQAPVANKGKQNG